MEIGGLAQGTQYDVVNITGQAFLNGRLDLKLINGFVPAANQTFVIMTASAFSGWFANAVNGQRLPTVDGTGSFRVHYGPGSAFGGTLMVLSDFQVGRLPGDYNENGVVDAADYVVWRNNLGSGTSLPNDNTPGVGQDDYNMWRSQFGQPAGSGLALPFAESLSAVVP